MHPQRRDQRGDALDELLERRDLAGLGLVQADHADIADVLDLVEAAHGCFRVLAVDLERGGVIVARDLPPAGPGLRVIHLDHAGGERLLIGRRED